MSLSKAKNRERMRKQRVKLVQPSVQPKPVMLGFSQVEPPKPKWLGTKV